MSEPIETGRRFVNTWQCDENLHQNVQFYFWDFEDATAHFLYETGWPSDVPIPYFRNHHVRFHGELHVGDLTYIVSHLARHEGITGICHQTIHAETGKLSATCWCPIEDAISDKLDAPWLEVPEAALPRSVNPEPAPAASLPDVAAAGYDQTFRGVVSVQDCFSTGQVRTKSLIGFQSDAAGHFWTRVGLTTAWLNENNLGRVAMESRMTILGEIKAGTPIVFLTGLTDFTAKTFSFRHYAFDVRTGAYIASGDITGLSIDLDKRKTAPWPDDMIRNFETKLVKSLSD